MEERAWVVTISWGAGGRDLDIFTTVSSGGQTTSGIGWNNGSQTSVIQVNSGGINGTFYAKWGGDNTRWAGNETVTVYFRGTLPSSHTQIATVTPHCNYYGEGSGPATVVVDGQAGSYEVASPSTRYGRRAEASDPYVDVPLYADGGTPTPFPNLVTVSLNPNGGSVSPGALYYIDPTSSTKYGTLPTPTNSNASVFLGWFTAASGGTQVTADSTLVSASSHTLYAQWKHQVYVWRWAATPSTGAYVELDEVRDSGGLYPYVSKDYLSGQTAKLFAYLNNPLYRFKGWYRVDPGDPQAGGTLIGTDVRLSLVVSSNVNIRGDFEFIGLHLKVGAVDATNVTVSINGQYDPSRTWEYYADVLIGSTVTLGASIHDSNRDYLRFVHWEDENGNVLSTDNQHSFTASGQAEDWQYYYARYYDCSNIKSSVSPDGGGTITYSRSADSPPDSPGDHWYVAGSSVSLTATPASGYTFAYWSWTQYGKTRKSYNATYSFDSVGGIEWELTAHFKSSNECLIKAESDGKCTVSGDGIYTIGTSCTITASFDTQYYEFDHWEKDGASVSTSASYTFTVTEDATFTAYVKYREFTVAVSADPSEGGTATGGGTYHYADSVALRASPSTGYRFSGWYEDDRFVSANPIHTLTVAQDRTFVARFSKQTFTISVYVSGGGGSVTGGGVYEYGDTCTLTATAENLYTFVRWNDDDTSATKTFTVTQNKSFAAYFARGLRITTVASPEEGGTTTGDGIYEYSDYVRLEATPSRGYELDHWEKDGDVVGYSDWLTFTFKWSDAGTYTAVFSLISKGELIYDEATGRLICSDSGQLIYHDKMTPSH